MKRSCKTIILFGLLALANAAVLASDAVLWKFQIGRTIYATPVIRDGVVYIGSLDSVFYAIDAKTGAERWRYKASNQIFTTAAIGQNLVCFESNNQLYGLDLQGGLKWQTPLSSDGEINQHDEWDYFHSSPLLVDSVAYAGGVKGHVVGVHIRTGSVLFHVQTPSQSTVKTRPAVYNNKIYFGDWDGVLYVYDLRTGEKAWEYDTKKDNTYSWVNAIQTDPLIWKAAVYFAGRSCNLYSLNPETGVRNWFYHDPGNMWLLGGPALSDSTLYLGSSNQHTLHAFNSVKGEKKWQQEVDYRIFGKPLVDGDYVFVGTGNEYYESLGSLCALDKQSGELVNRLALNGQVHSSPVIDDGILYLGCGDGFVYAVDRQNFLATLIPNTDFKDENNINLGNIPTDKTDFQSTVCLYNTGAGFDSVRMSLAMSSFLVKSNAVTVGPVRFGLAPGDSQAVTIRIDASRLKENKYIVYLMFESRYNLKQRTEKKMFNFTVVGATGAKADRDGLSESFAIEQNYPNPFNLATAISFSLPKTARVSLDIFDMLGRKVMTLTNGIVKAGRHIIIWNGLNDNGKPVGTGAYYYRMETITDGRSQSQIRKMLLIK
jgi:outer membrane protein assembly factor BamB